MPRKVPTYGLADVPMTIFPTQWLDYSSMKFVSTNPIRKRHGMYAALGSLSTTPHKLTNMGVTGGKLCFDAQFTNGDKLVEVIVTGQKLCGSNTCVHRDVVFDASSTLEKLIASEIDLTHDLSRRHIHLDLKRDSLEWAMLAQSAANFSLKTPLWTVCMSPLAVAEAIPSLIGFIVESHVITSLERYNCLSEILVHCAEDVPKCT